MSLYRDAGVDIEAGHEAVRRMKGAVERTHGPEVLTGLGSFGGLFDASRIKGMAAPILVSSTDGVGTKTKVATAVGRFDTIGQDIVNHCIDDILVQGAEPLFFLDYIAASRLDPEQVATVVAGAAKACEENGVALLGGETAEMPGVYVAGELDLAGTIVGVVDRSRLITGQRIGEGDLVYALASDGLHTNGFSLARKALAGRDLQAPVAELGGASLADALLAPHRSYLPDVRNLWAAEVPIHGLAHITGGGLVDNPPRVLPEGLAFHLDMGSYELPPLFRLLQEAAGVPDAELRQVFNCGVGMLVVVPAAAREAAEAAFASGPTSWWRMGSIQASQGAPVVFS